MRVCATTPRTRWGLWGLFVLLTTAITPSVVEGSPIVYSRLPICVLLDCGPGNAIPNDISSNPNWFVPHAILTPITFAQDTVVDEIDFWTQAPFATFTVQTVADVGDPPCCQNAPPVATLSPVPGIHAELFGVDPNCQPPSSCTFYSVTMPLGTPFLAQGGVRYYLSADADLVVGFRQIGLDAGTSWQTALCHDGHNPCPAEGAAFVLRGTTAPEPASVLLVLTGLIAVGFRAIYRK